MKAKTYLTFLVVGLLAISSIFAVGAVTAQEDDDQWRVQMEEGSTDRFGGGDYRYFKFSNQAGTDAMFGVIWGTEENPNSIVMVSTQARYLAKVQVKMQGGEGQQIQDQKFVKMNSLLGTTIGRIYEYNDLNQNGVVNLLVNEDGEISSELEEVYKYVDLREAEWTSSEVKESEKGDNTTWEFTLTAQDLPYKPVKGGLSPGMEEEVLDYLNFTFHLSAGTREVRGADMPSFDVSVRKGLGNRVMLRDAKRNGTTEVDGTVGTYDMKWDHEVDGWDYEEHNQNPMLAMTFMNMYGNEFPAAKYRWQWRFMHQVQEREGVQFMDQQGEHITNFTDPTSLRERILRQNRIEYGSDWSRVGRFRWESNVTVDGEPSKMTSQIIFGAPWVQIGPFTRNFVGFQVWGGLNYPGGEHIFHDPAQSGSAYLEISESSTDGGFNLPFRGLFLFVVAGAIIVVVIAALLYRKEDEYPTRRNQYDTREPKKEEDWSDYYDRGD